MNSRQENLKKLVKSLNQKPVAYYPIYRNIMGSIAGGVMLSQIMFWWGVADGDEFYKSDSELMKETGLSEWEIKNEKFKLKSLPFLKFERKGVPPTTHYTVDIDKFNEKLSNSEHELPIGSIRRPRSKSNRSTFSEYIKSTRSESNGGACSESFICTENIQRVSESKKDKKNIPVQVKSSEPSNFEKLIDWWYKCKGEENPGLEPPRYKGKRFTEVVTDRLNENRTWEQIDAAIEVYWEIVKSPAHYYNSGGDITWFLAMGIDRFWNPKDAMEFFKIKNKNGTNGKTEHRVTPAPESLYFKPPEKKQISAEARAAEDAELMATIKNIKSKFNMASTDAEISV